MKETFQFEKSFGPVASFAGYVILIAGLAAMYFTLAGLLLVLFGAFVGFTSSCTTIDYTFRKAKYSKKIFGFIKIGKWLDITEGMSIGIKKSDKIYRTYSRGNRTLDISKTELRIYLFDLQKRPVIPLKKIEKIKNSEKEIEDLSKRLQLTIIEQ